MSRESEDPGGDIADTKEWEIKHCVQYAVYILPLVEGSEETAKGENPLFTLRIKVVTEVAR